MYAVWKFPLVNREYNTFEIKMPLGAKVLTFQMQDEVPTIWALVNTQEFDNEVRRFDLLGTGFEFERTTDKSYIGTVQQGWLVWHLFEVK